jgi:hypothetical protein
LNPVLIILLRLTDARYPEDGDEGLREEEAEE